MLPMVDAADAVASPTPDVPADVASTEVAPDVPAPAESASEPIMQSASERMPKDAEGNPLYEQADAELAWDALVEQAGGDESVAQSVADGMVADMEAALKKLEKTKPQGGASVPEKIAAAQKRKAEIDVD